MRGEGFAREPRHAVPLGRRRRQLARGELARHVADLPLAFGQHGRRLGTWPRPVLVKLFRYSTMPRIDPNNSTQYWWDRHLAGLSLMHADFTTHEYPPHTHDALVVADHRAGRLGGEEPRRGAGRHAIDAVRVQSRGTSRRLDGTQRALALPLALSDATALDRVAGGLGIDAVPYFTRNTFADRDLIDAFLAMHWPRGGPRRVRRARAAGRRLRHAVPAPRQRPQPDRGAAARPRAAGERDRAHARASTPPTCASRSWPPTSA